MNFGVWIPNCRHLATADLIRGTAIRAEQLGYDSVWGSDHVEHWIRNVEPLAQRFTVRAPDHPGARRAIVLGP
jgi:alkanesulfonate monooxygenase SsuD/methylene tetrahydromethanopterin reductase-like flavin-dependent oxidoreductase (luciferase family)